MEEAKLPCLLARSGPDVVSQWLMVALVSVLWRRAWSSPSASSQRLLPPKGPSGWWSPTAAFVSELTRQSPYPFLRLLVFRTPYLFVMMEMG